MNTISTLRIFFSGCFIALAMASSSYAYEMRTWTAMNGKQVEAAFVKYDSNSFSVSMQKRDGSIVKVNRDNLSDEDWMYVAKFDDRILSFSVFLGEINVRQITSQTVGKFSVLSIRRGGITDIHSPQWTTIEKVMRTPVQSLRFFATDDHMCIAKIGSATVGRFPIPEQVEECFLPPHIAHPNPRWNSSAACKAYRTLDHRDRSSPHYDRYTDWIKWAWFSSGKMTTQPIEYTILAINNSIWTNSEQHEIPDAIFGQDDANQTHQDSGISYFLLDKIASEKVSTFCYNASAHRLSADFEQMPRYKRLKTKYENLSKGVPNQVASSSNRKYLGSGSCFCISADGFFLTNYHVVRGGNDIKLLTNNGMVQASIVRIDPAVDLALLKASGQTFSPLSFSQETEISLGQDIFTIGFPMPDLQGFSPKMTKGVISSMKGMHDDDKEYQIDAAIQPGNSGGPVVNNNGEVVGVVVASLREQYVAETRGILPQNVNYAIKKKHVIDFISQVPNCLRGIQSSNLPPSTSSASPATVDSVVKSCAMVVVYE